MHLFALQDVVGVQWTHCHVQETSLKRVLNHIIDSLAILVNKQVHGEVNMYFCLQQGTLHHWSRGKFSLVHTVITLKEEKKRHFTCHGIYNFGKRFFIYIQAVLQCHSCFPFFLFFLPLSVGHNHQILYGYTVLLCILYSPCW